MRKVLLVLAVLLVTRPALAGMEVHTLPNWRQGAAVVAILPTLNCPATVDCAASERFIQEKLRAAGIRVVSPAFVTDAIFRMGLKSAAEADRAALLSKIGELSGQQVNALVYLSVDGSGSAMPDPLKAAYLATADTSLEVRTSSELLARVVSRSGGATFFPDGQLRLNAQCRNMTAALLKEK